MLQGCFFPRTATCWNSLPIEYFHLVYNLNGFSLELTDTY